MAYSTIADVQIAAGGASRLRELSDTERANEINPAAVESAIAEADATINTYVQKRHGVDLEAPVPAAIRTLSAAMAVFILKSRKANMLSDADFRLHDERIKTLEAMKRGDVTLGVSPAPAKSELVVDAATDRSDLVISRASMRGFC